MGGSCISPSFHSPAVVGITPMVDFKADVTAVNGASKTRMRRRSSKTRVYIADDNVLLRRGLASVIRGERDLELCGETSNCTTASGEVCQLRPDVVIVELSINGDRGIELIETIKAFDSGIRIVVLSLLDETVYAFPAFMAGASAYVPKQAQPARVIDAIRKARSGQMCVSDIVSSQMLDRVAKGQGPASFSPTASLSSRELEIFKLIGSGQSNREIADLLQISIKTVETHRAHIKEKANLTSGFELLQFSTRWSESGAAVPAWVA